MLLLLLAKCAVFNERIWEHVAFAFIIGGAIRQCLGPLISVIAVGYGGVRDFIHVDFNWFGIDYIWPTFNIADCGITVGAAIAIIASFSAKPATRRVKSRRK